MNNVERVGKHLQKIKMQLTFTLNERQKTGEEGSLLELKEQLGSLNVALSLPGPQSLDQVVVHWGAEGREKVDADAGRLGQGRIGLDSDLGIK